MNIEAIAKIHTDFPEKFGVPRQSGLAGNVSKIVFQKKYRSPEVVRGLAEFSHLWLIWEFDRNEERKWSPTVRPPRLGGNKRVGVFATRSPYRPNPLGLSCVEIAGIDTECEEAPVIYVLGADIVNGTPIYDIKPYIPYADCRENARGGFAEDRKGYELEVHIPKELTCAIDKDKLKVLTDILKGDPRPAYQDDAGRIYKMTLLGLDIEFKVDGRALTVVSACLAH